MPEAEAATLVRSAGRPQVAAKAIVQCARERREAQGLEADTILVAVGGGGLIAGALAWIDGRRKVVAVEPETACALHAALEAGSQVDVTVSGVAASALGASRVGDICFDLAREKKIESILVSDAAIIDAQQALWQNLRLAVEPGGAACVLLVSCLPPRVYRRVYCRALNLIGKCRDSFFCV